MDLHHGKIRVFSNGEGTGCTFTVDLPMTRKIDPLVVGNVSNMRRRSTRDRLVGMVRPSTHQSHHIPIPSAMIPAQLTDANHPATMTALQALNRRASDPCHQRETSPMVTDYPVSSTYPSPRAQLMESQRLDQADGTSVRLVMSDGRQSLLVLAENDRMMTNAAQEANATLLLLKQPTDRNSLLSYQLQGGSGSTGGPLMSSLSPLLGEPTHEDAAAAAVLVGSDHAIDPPAQEVRPAATSVVTSSPSPAQESVPLSTRAAVAATAVASALSLSLQLPSSTPSAVSAVSSPRSQRQSPKEQKPQGPVYHVLVIDDSTMTRKMLMKTLRNEGLTHCIHASNHTHLMQHITVHPFNPSTHTL